MTVELEGFPQCNFESFLQFLVGSFLTIYTGDFRDPANPPLSLLLHNSGIFMIRISFYQVLSGSNYIVTSVIVKLSIPVIS